jgi:hypothetical protein
MIIIKTFKIKWILGILLAVAFFAQANAQPVKRLKKDFSKLKSGLNPDRIH